MGELTVFVWLWGWGRGGVGVGPWGCGRKGGAMGEGSGEGGRGSSVIRVFQKFNSIQLFLYYFLSHKEQFRCGHGGLVK